MSYHCRMSNWPVRRLRATAGHSPPLSALTATSTQTLGLLRWSQLPCTKKLGLVKGQVKSDRECETRDWLKGTGRICEDIYTKHFFLATDFRSHLERQTSNWSPLASLHTTRLHVRKLYPWTSSSLG
ncbi:hypothetical protein VKT23_013667 [Stygiomarasmius scandens]|uniref:Uncharacterized protein n=1 Tax=Marasmiellus scandens TaxID=2682957 RepID=A0ABR1J5J1_9AGAR